MLLRAAMTKLIEKTRRELIAEKVAFLCFGLTNEPVREFLRKQAEARKIE